jgi:hemerythrin-like domain-containing protein
MLNRGPKDEPEIFFDVLRAMLFYIDEIPEKQHHVKESTLLFPTLVARSPQVIEVINKLEKEHAKGEAEVQKLQQLLVAWEMLGELRRQEFEDATHKYLDFYLEHLRIEETVIIPEAIKVLTDEDWKKLDLAFQSNTDPLSKRNPRISIYDRLFTNIVMRAPTPIGLGHS